VHRGLVSLPSARAARTGWPEADWGDWRWQLRSSLRTLEDLEGRLELTEAERAGVLETAGVFRMAITPYYFSLIDGAHPFCPIRMQAIPVRAETRRAPADLRDPLGEDPNRPVPSIVHKYPDRVLFLVLDTCAVYCRHCTRRRITAGGEATFDRAVMEEGLAYIRAHPQVRDVLISGGDPLLLADHRLDALLGALAAIPHVEMIRIGTRIPVLLPMRIDDELCRTLRRHAPVYVVTHFNHPKEITPEAAEACERLVDHGVPVENQTVLLRQVNSSARVIRDLNHRLLRHRVRPYYLHQGDLAEGTEHLRTPLSCGIEIVEALRGHTTGLAVPHLAVDLPGGGGKVTVQPDYLLGQEGGVGRFRNYEGVRYDYPDPEQTDCTCPYDAVWYGDDAQSERATGARVR
jgi:lysine 2,3-aminomutase